MSVPRKRPAAARSPVRRGAVTARVGAGATALALLLASAGLFALLPGSASAVPAYGLLTCTGSLAKETPNAAEPNLTSYQFQCTQNIDSYTIIVGREPSNFDTIDVFDSSPSVLDPTDKIVSATESVSCQGITPGDGFNCSAAQTPSSSPQVVDTTNWVQGDFDTIDPFCSYYATGKKAPETPVPSANAQLIVSDQYGNEFGPFVLPMKPGCKAPSKPMTSPRRSQGSGVRAGSKKTHTH